MVLIYGILSFIRLGSTVAPKTYKEFANEEDEIIISLKEETVISKIRYYVGDGLGEVFIYSSPDGKTYEEAGTINIGGVFYWSDITINRYAKYLKFSNATPHLALSEIALYDANNNIIPVFTDTVLTDEGNLVPDEISFMNSTYFDEIYYGRTAYEYAHGIDVYEWTHPPLGKLIMTIPVALFGFSLLFFIVEFAGRFHKGLPKKIAIYFRLKRLPLPERYHAGTRHDGQS